MLAHQLTGSHAPRWHCSETCTYFSSFADCSNGCLLCTGLRNLIMVLFAATTIRLMIENFLKYGIRINPKNWVMAVLTPEGDHPLSHALSHAYHMPYHTLCWHCLFCLLNSFGHMLLTSITLSVTQAFDQLSHKHYTSGYTSLIWPVTQALYQKIHRRYTSCCTRQDCKGNKRLNIAWYMLAVVHSSKCIQDLTVCGIILQAVALLSMLAFCARCIWVAHL